MKDKYRIVMPIALVIIAIIITLSICNIGYAKDTIVDKTKDQIIKELKTENTKLKVKLAKAISILERKIEATPTDISFSTKGINFKIDNISYLIFSPNPLEGWTKDLYVGLDYSLPSFQSFSSGFDFANSKFTIELGYDVFGFYIYTNYDFINDWRLGVSVNLMYFVNALVKK